MTDGPLHLEVAAGVATVTIDHPPINLFDLVLYPAMSRMAEALAADNAVRVVVLRSANPEFFVAHFDVTLIPPLPKSLAPGERQEVTFKLTVPAQKTGRISTYFEIHSDAVEPVFRIPFTAEVLNIKFDPASLNFGNMEAGGDAKILVSTLTLDAPAKISGTSCPVPYFMPEATEVIEENKSYRIHVSAKFEDGTTGIRNSYAVLFLDPVDPSLAWPKQIRVPLKARVMPKKAP